MSVTRTLELIQRRAITFLTVYLGAVISLSILFLSLKSRETACSESSHELQLPIFISGSLNAPELFDVLLSTMSKQSLNARLKVQNASTHSGTFTSLDTIGGALHHHNVRVLIQRTGDSNDKRDAAPVTYHFRYLTDSLCDHPLPFSLDVNHNVDLDIISFKKESTVINGTRLFVRESTLRTSLVQSLTTTQQLLSILPGARELQLGTAATLQVTHDAHYRVVCNAPVLSSRGVTSVQLLLEEWITSPSDLRYWKLTLRTSNPTQEALMTKLWLSLRQEFAANTISDASLGIQAEF